MISRLQFTTGAWTCPPDAPRALSVRAMPPLAKESARVAPGRIGAREAFWVLGIVLTTPQEVLLKELRIVVSKGRRPRYVESEEQLHIEWCGGTWSPKSSDNGAGVVGGMGWGGVGRDGVGLGAVTVAPVQRHQAAMPRW